MSDPVTSDEVNVSDITGDTSDTKQEFVWEDCRTPVCLEYTTILKGINDFSTADIKLPTIKEVEEEKSPNQKCRENCQLFEKQYEKQCQILRKRVQKWLKDKKCPSIVSAPKTSSSRTRMSKRAPARRTRRGTFKRSGGCTSCSYRR